MAKTILVIVGSYRKNRIIDRMVTEALSSAEAWGATTSKGKKPMRNHPHFCENSGSQGNISPIISTGARFQRQVKSLPRESLTS